MSRSAAHTQKSNCAQALATARRLARGALDEAEHNLGSLKQLGIRLKYTSFGEDRGSRNFSIDSQSHSNICDWESEPALLTFAEALSARSGLPKTVMRSAGPTGEAGSPRGRRIIQDPPDVETRVQWRRLAPALSWGCGVRSGACSRWAMHARCTSEAYLLLALTSSLSAYTLFCRMTVRGQFVPPREPG